MSSPVVAQDTLKCLHYLTPLIVILYYFVATAVGVCRLHTSTFAGKRNPRNAILGMMVLAIITYIIEDGLILSQLSSGTNPFATTDSNIYVLASILAWFVLTATLLSSETASWIPYYGSWIITFMSETITFCFHMTRIQQFTNVERAQVIVQVVRLIVLACLSALTFALPKIKLGGSHGDEEAAPLLQHLQQSSEESQGSAGASTYGSTVTTEAAGAKPSTETDDSLDEVFKEEREQRERMDKRLQETGNWWTYIRRFSIFVPYIWPSGKPRLHLRMVGVGLCLLAIRVLNVLVPRQLGLVVNSLGQPDKIHPFVELGIYVVLAATESSAGIRAWRTYLWLPVENHAYQSIDCASYNHIMSLSSDFHDSKNSGELYQAMWQGHSVIQLLETLLYQLAPMLVDLLVACVFLYYLFDAYMLLIVSSTMVLYLWASVQFTLMQTHARRKHVITSRRSYQVLFDTMGGWRTVSYFNRLQHAKDAYANSRALHLVNRKSMYLISCWTEGLQGLILDIGLFSACFYAVYQIVYNGLSVGQFITLFTYWANLAGPLDTLASAHRHLLSLLVDAEQLLELFQTKPSVKDGFGRLNICVGKVEFERVHFSYDGKKQVIEDMSFKAEPGKTIALIGESGGGKSTVLKLLFRFYDVTKGSIRIDGQDIRSVSLQSLRDCIGVVPQDPSLFNDTIMTNLRYAKLDASDEEVMDACKAAAIHDKILTFSKGYDSKVGEHGIKLSGGELQRIAIARAILKDPRIILLDEATSSVDSETEAKIQEALEKLSKGRTTFIVAHRLSTIEHADLILVIKDGAILEQGPPAELLQSKGKYYHLWVKQMGIRDLPKTPDSGSGEAEDGVSSATTEGKPSQAPNEAGKPGRTSKRPDVHKSASSKSMVVFGALGKKMFRPDAPEFIPQYQRSTAASGGNDESHQHTSGAHRLGHDAGSSKPDKDKKQSQRSRKRKARQEVSGAAPNDASNNSSNLDGSSDIPAPADVTSKREAEPKPKRSRFDRRHQSRSEPAGQGLQQSQGDGISEADGSPMGSAEGRPMRNTSRRVTAPSDPPSGPSVTINGGRLQHRRRKRHWRSRNSNVASSSGNTTGTQSSSTARDWSSDSHSTNLPTAPFPTPAGGVTPISEMTGGASANGVRFAPGS